jgi:hypothetical protein
LARHEIEAPAGPPKAYQRRYSEERPELGWSGQLNSPKRHHAQSAGDGVAVATVHLPLQRVEGANRLRPRRLGWTYLIDGEAGRLDDISPDQLGSCSGTEVSGEPSATAQP